MDITIQFWYCFLLQHLNLIDQIVNIYLELNYEKLGPSRAFVIWWAIFPILNIGKYLHWPKNSSRLNWTWGMIIIFYTIECSIQFLTARELFFLPIFQSASLDLSYIHCKLLKCQSYLCWFFSVTRLVFNLIIYHNAWKKHPEFQGYRGKGYLFFRFSIFILCAKVNTTQVSYLQDPKQLNQEERTCHLTLLMNGRRLDQRGESLQILVCLSPKKDFFQRLS